MRDGTPDHMRSKSVVFLWSPKFNTNNPEGFSAKQFAIHHRDVAAPKQHASPHGA